MQTRRPNAHNPLVITMGDPAGIGPEIILTALRRRPDWLPSVIVAGDLPTLRRAQALTQPVKGSGDLVLQAVSSVDEALALAPGHLAVVQACALGEPVPFGRISAVAGQAAADCIHWAAKAALSGRVRAMVTAPIHKEALAAAGYDYPGHTEFLQALAAEHEGVTVSQLPVRMMLSCPGLRTVLVSIHVSLRQALQAVTQQQLLQTLRITADHFRRIGMPQARMAVAGLNPHAGEGGLFGREEIDVIAPAVEKARSDGLNVSGPHAPDTVFMRARQGEFDVVLAMYHDQGLIPVKLLGLDDGVNTTLGLPFVRTSPDHGTAFDLAGTGRASPSSLLAAIEAAEVTCPYAAEGAQR
ncbi:MAG: 4-hydroxythreonine-4-phosphate dehydrogenase PdxA [Hydrogenophaga sp.]